MISFLHYSSIVLQSYNIMYRFATIVEHALAMWDLQELAASLPTQVNQTILEVCVVLYSGIIIIIMCVYVWVISRGGDLYVIYTLRAEGLRLCKSHRDRDQECIIDS